MFARKICTGIAAVAVSVSALALGVGAASAAGSVQDGDDTTTPASPSTTALTGVGSDTSQHALKLLADAYNGTNPGTPLFTYAATSGGTISLSDGTTINRPNGSGAGKALLYGSGPNGSTTGNNAIQFARSSSAESDAEVSAQLQSFPFAVDTLVTAVSGSTASHAPANLTAAQLVGIYQCSTGYTTWNGSGIGGSSSATIHPLLPQTGSGTRNFFLAQLKAANNGVDITPGSCVNTSPDTTYQEQDPAPIANNADAIAPFSRGRAVIAGTLRVEGGFSAQRALYNVVRNRDVASAGVLAAFGSNGYLCSAAAKQYITASGFDQMLTPSKGGACGAPTQSATTNFTTAQVSTTTSVAVSSASSATQTAAKIVATVTGSSAPSGTVSFYEGTTLIGANIPLVSGSATRIQPTTAGAHTYRAVYTPAANTAFTGSEGTGSGTVSAATLTVTKSKSSAKEGFKSKYVVGKPIKGKVTISLPGSAQKATGQVKVLEGKKTVGKGKLKAGKATVTLKHLKLGKNKLKLIWGGDANGVQVKKSFTIVVVKG